MKRKILSVVSPVVVLRGLLIGVAAVLLFAKLDIKPPHFDEGVNGWFVDLVWSKGYYPYRGSNFHGPLFFYWQQFFQVLFGRTIEVLRAGSAVFSLAVLGIVLARANTIGAVAIAGATLLSSTAFLFYSRYGIHEPLFVFFQVLFSLSLLRFFKSSQQRAWYHALLCLCAMMALKETWVISVFSCGVALGLTHSVQLRHLRGQVGGPLILHSCLILGGGLVLVYSGFGLDWQGLAEFFKSYWIWTDRGLSGEGHEKPWFYWLKLMAHYEMFLLVILVLATMLYPQLSKEGRFWLLLFVVQGVVYSLIPYKTPWCFLSMLWPLALLAIELEAAMSRLWKDRKREIRGVRGHLKGTGAAIVVLALLVGFGFSSWHTWQLSFQRYADPREPYVYVQTNKSYHFFMNLLNRKTEKKSINHNLRIVLLGPKLWPLPWSLSTFPRFKVSGWKEHLVPDKDIVIVLNEDKERTESLLIESFYRYRFPLRPAQAPLWVYFRASVFNDVVPSHWSLITPNE